MFRDLFESGARTQRRPGWTLTSAGAHAMLIGLATVLTLRHPLPSVEPVRLEELFFTVPHEPALTPAIPDEAAPGSPGWRVPLDIPITIPAIPDVSLSTETRPLLPASDSLGPGVVRDAFLRRPLGDHIYTERLVDRAVSARPDNPQPAYPAILRSAQVAGEVLVQFVVDTLGRVEPQSIKILRATHPLFADSVRRWLARTRYGPAEVDGRPVRQLVQQEVAFTLRP